MTQQTETTQTRDEQIRALAVSLGKVLIASGLDAEKKEELAIMTKALAICQGGLHEMDWGTLTIKYADEVPFHIDKLEGIKL